MVVTSEALETSNWFNIQDRAAMDDTHMRHDEFDNIALPYHINSQRQQYLYITMQQDAHGQARHSARSVR